jgi:hypothetical protein
MEKLIELLNEYVEKHNKSDLYYTFELEDNWWLFCYDNVTDHKWWTMQDEAMVICSKKYWFIKWLVENEKIDFSLIPNKITEIWIPMKINWEIKYGFDSSDYYWLLMLLSISDTPIEDLISYLK